jgi:hypothetical protein
MPTSHNAGPAIRGRPHPVELKLNQRCSDRPSVQQTGEIPLAVCQRDTTIAELIMSYAARLRVTITCSP